MVAGGRLKMPYACKDCGFVHDGTKTTRVRVDQDTSAMFCSSGSCSHGWVTYRICPKCKSKDRIKWEDDKNHPHIKREANYKKTSDYRKKLLDESEIGELETEIADAQFKIKNIKYEIEKKANAYYKTLE
jgi:hypothetical protein